MTIGVEAGATRYASPERRWRAGLTVVAAACLGWYLSSRLASLAGIVAGSALGAGSLCLAAPIIRSHLAVNSEGASKKRRQLGGTTAGDRLGRLTGSAG